MNSWHLSELIIISRTPVWDSGEGRLRLLALIGVGLRTLDPQSIVEGCGLVRLSEGESTLMELFELVGDGGSCSKGL